MSPAWGLLVGGVLGILLQPVFRVAPQVWWPLVLGATVLALGLAVFLLLIAGSVEGEDGP